MTSNTITIKGVQKALLQSRKTSTPDNVNTVFVYLMVRFGTIVEWEYPSVTDQNNIYQGPIINGTRKDSSDVLLGIANSLIEESIKKDRNDSYCLDITDCRRLKKYIDKKIFFGLIFPALKKNIYTIEVDNSSESNFFSDTSNEKEIESIEYKLDRNELIRLLNEKEEEIKKVNIEIEKLKKDNPSANTIELEEKQKELENNIEYYNNRLNNSEKLSNKLHILKKTLDYLNSFSEDDISGEERKEIKEMKGKVSERIEQIKRVLDISLEDPKLEFKENKNENQDDIEIDPLNFWSYFNSSQSCNGVNEDGFSSCESQGIPIFSRIDAADPLEFWQGGE